ncbi:hypothetical protein ACO02O_01307 [Dirofilaria immitis]
MFHCEGRREVRIRVLALDLRRICFALKSMQSRFYGSPIGENNIF